MKAQTRIILIGMKSSGKTTTGKRLAHQLGIRFTDMDAEIELHHAELKGEKLAFREIFKQYGQDYFRTLETATLEALTSQTNPESLVLATGGGLPLAKENQTILKCLGTVVYLDVDPQVLLARIIAGGLPAFFPYPDDPRKSLAEILAIRRPVYLELAHLTVTCGAEPSEVIVENILNQLENSQRED